VAHLDKGMGVRPKQKEGCLTLQFVYFQLLHLLHLFERHNVSASAFPWSFNLIPGNLLHREITLLLYFSEKFSRKFTFSPYFPANDRKPIETLSLSTELQWEKNGN
jgi:hypothetical protein